MKESLANNNRPYTASSRFLKQYDFSDIQPYYDHEVKDVLKRMIPDPKFMTLVNQIWPERTHGEVVKIASGITTALEFQKAFMHGAIRRIIERSASSLTCSGFNRLDPDKAYLFVSNHRDILLDAAILQVLLVEHGFETSEISFGSNLMEKGFITDFGKLNRMFTVQREGTAKELYESSQKLSAYIRHTITEKNVSIWIAQRNGRTKDGNDVTQPGLLKMLNLSGDADFAKNFGELCLVPMTISYEYEPCDDLKAQEICLSTLHSKYVKAPGEDVNSIVKGIQQFKGHIHLSVGEPIDVSQFREMNGMTENEKFRAMAAEIDRTVYKNYLLHEVNYIAHDLLTGTQKYAKNYSEKSKEKFKEYVAQRIKPLKGEPAMLHEVFLKQYAQPVVNRELVSK